jgi:FAD/FMN-containing dehydrogenase
MNHFHLQLNSLRLLRARSQWKERLAQRREQHVMTAIRSVATAATKLNRTFRGELLKPGDAGYEEARKVHNGLVDKRPALIARCRQTTDVADAIKLTQRLGLEVAVRGGGHNVAGRATIDGGVMIDLAPMKEIRVDPENRTVRAQGGVTWAELNREMQ